MHCIDHIAKSFKKLFIFFWEDSTIKYGVVAEGIDCDEAYVKADF